jgi:alanyl-tRNA synthetase
VRRLIRRAIRHGHLLGIQGAFVSPLAEAVVKDYRDLYPELGERREVILSEIATEEERFARTLSRGLVEFEKWVDRSDRAERRHISGEEAFDLYQTYGFPLELTIELAAERGLTVDEEGFQRAFAEHQQISRAGLDKRFMGGLGDQSTDTIRLHTATHLLHAALRAVLGPHVQQKGSNITPERLRFDFSHPRAMTPEEVAQVEEMVNQIIRQDLPVSVQTMTLEEAQASGALAFFGEKYGEQVKVYSVDGFSREVCGGPHVASTGELGHLCIVKEQSSGQGVRRIRAVLESD